jgi:hypothetical protein
METSEIEQSAEAVLSQIGYESGPVPLHTIGEAESRSNGLAIERRPPGPREMAHTVLGHIDFEARLITVFAYPEANPGRERFTLAHELGHHFLDHARFMISEDCEDEDLQEQPEPGDDDIRRLEYQADRFASCLLLPTVAFRDACLRVAAQLDLRDRGRGVLYLDDQKCNREAYDQVRGALATEFKASRLAVSKRLKALGLVTDARTRSVSSPVALHDLIG